MNTVRIKLTLGFVLVSLISVLLVAVFVQRYVTNQFNEYVFQERTADFVARAEAHYQRVGSWDVLRAQTANTANLPPPQRGPFQPLEDFAGGPPQGFALMDIDGVVVLPFLPHYESGQQVEATVLQEAIPVNVDAQTVGYVVGFHDESAVTPEQRTYITRTNQALLFAAVGGVFLAAMLGLVSSAVYTRPLRELSAVVGRVAQGDFDQQVRVSSGDELGQLAASINHMSRQLAQSHQVRRQMTADIAHDLRGPLQVIGGYLEAMKDGVLKPTPQRFATLYDEAMLLERLVEDLRTLSLVDSGELPLNPQPIPPAELLERVRQTYQRPAAERGLRLSTDVMPDLPLILVDFNRMVQVLGNLVANAIRHTAQGWILITAKGEGAGVLLRVADTGEGIDEEMLPLIFERFYRGDRSRQQVQGETGLGLAIAKSIVEAHGGRITVESQRGQGTTFTLYLPTAPPPA